MQWRALWGRFWGGKNNLFESSMIPAALSLFPCWELQICLFIRWLEWNLPKNYFLVNNVCSSALSKVVNILLCSCWWSFFVVFLLVSWPKSSLMYLRTRHYQGQRTTPVPSTCYCHEAILWTCTNTTATVGFAWVSILHQPDTPHINKAVIISWLWSCPNVFVSSQVWPQGGGVLPVSQHEGWGTGRWGLHPRLLVCLIGLKEGKVLILCSSWQDAMRLYYVCTAPHCGHRWTE